MSSAMMNQGVQIQSSPMEAAPSPRHPGGPDATVSLGLSPRPLDGDFDEEIHGIILAPPPPPPPPRRNSKGGNGSSRHERKTMQEQYQQYQQPPPSTSHGSESHQQREPLNSLTPDPEQQQTQQYALTQQQQKEQHDAPKEHSGCDPNAQYPENSSSSSSNNNDVTKKKKEPKSSSHSRPPIQPGAKSAEYGSRIESFHKVMLENIEKETMMIRSQGSFQLHQKNLSNKSKNRSSSGSNNNNNNNNSHGDNSENQNGGTKHRRRNSSSRMDASGAMIASDNANVGSLLKETMKDISVAAAQTMESLKSALQHTKDRAAGNDLNAETGAIACGGMDDMATSDSLNGILDPAKTPRTSSSRTPGIANVPMLRTSSGTELMKKMHEMSDAFRKVVVDATANGGDNDQRRDEKDEEENSNSAEAWGLGNVLANGFGWEGAGGGEYEDDDDDRSRATYDTWDEENSVLRRLGSWGTVNSQFTAGTIGTVATLGTMATYDTEAGPSIVGPVSVAVKAASDAKTTAEGEGGIVGPDVVPRNGDQLVVPGSHNLRSSADPLHDDDGCLIDPALVEAALKTKKKKKKRRGRRKKVVKFDYPPISSLRQYTRPAPEDLPKLFFTEHELDQIEDDRYSTMSTDDIEIVAVSSKENPGATSADEGDDAIDAKAKASKKKPVSFGSSPKASAEHEPGMKPVKGRSGTPDRRRTCGDASEKSPSKADKLTANNNKNSGEEPEGPSSPRRLVKGVQIYLRERSTGM